MPTIFQACLVLFDCLARVLGVIDAMHRLSFIGKSYTCQHHQSRLGWRHHYVTRDHAYCLLITA